MMLPTENTQYIDFYIGSSENVLYYQEKPLESSTNENKVVQDGKKCTDQSSKASSNTELGHKLCNFITKKIRHFLTYKWDISPLSGIEFILSLLVFLK